MNENDITIVCPDGSTGESAFRKETRADTTIPTPSDEAIVRQGGSIVIGQFTGQTRKHIRTYPGVDELGRPYRRVITARELIVGRLLAGERVQARVWVNTVGGGVDGLVTPPASARPTVDTPLGLSLLADPGSPTGGYVAMHSRFFPASTRADVEAFAALARRARQARGTGQEPSPLWPPPRATPSPGHLADVPERETATPIRISLAPPASTPRPTPTTPRHPPVQPSDVEARTPATAPAPHPVAWRPSLPSEPDRDWSLEVFGLLSLVVLFAGAWSFRDQRGSSRRDTTSRS